ncbi:MAG TPA: hypothetical protein VGL89_11600 [Candidatus Koribacter sp.]
MPRFQLLKYHLAHMFNWLFPKKAPIPSGLSVLLLQRKLSKFSTVELNRAMQRAWRQKHDPTHFCAYPGNELDCPLLKAFGEIFKITYSAKPLDPETLNLELPPWGFHTSYTMVQYDCPRLPEDSERKKMYCLLGLLCHELITDETAGFYFSQERVFARNTMKLQFMLASGRPFDPLELHAQTVLSK